MLNSKSIDIFTDRHHIREETLIGEGYPGVQRSPFGSSISLVSALPEAKSLQTVPLHGTVPASFLGATDQRRKAIGEKIDEKEKSTEKVTELSIVFNFQSSKLIPKSFKFEKVKK